MRLHLRAALLAHSTILLSLLYPSSSSLAFSRDCIQGSERIADRFRRAVDLQRKGDLREAESEYRAVLEAAPDYAEAHANLGAVLSRLDRYREAILSYERALELQPKLTPVLLNLGIAHYRQSEFEKAADALQQFLEKSPGHLQATQLLGLSLVELGRDREASEELRKALAEEPDDLAVLYGYGLASARLRSTKVWAVLDRLQQIPNGAGPAHLLRGQFYLMNSEFEKAASELEKASEINPRLPRMDYSLGLSYLKLDRKTEAVVCLEKELLRSPKDFSTLYYLAYLHEASEDWEKSRARIDAALSLEPDSAEANALLGKILFKQQKPGEAVKPLEAAVKRDPEDGDKRFLLARVYQQLGRHDEAEREFAESRRLKSEKLERDRKQISVP